MPIPTADEKLKWIKVEPPNQEEMAAVEKLSPGDYEVGFQRTNDILDEALEVFQRSCRSSMGVAGDVIVAIFTAQGDLVNCSAGTYLHAIIQPIMIKYILHYYSQNPGIKDGDIWFANDALYGGIHNPDMVVILPIFYHGRLIAWCGAANHTTETGANEPGGMSVTATARFNEGMNLPPVKLGENGQLREDWIEVFNAYGMRAPQMMITDLKARSTAADRTRTRVLELAEKEGLDFVVGLLRKMLLVAEEGARKRIASWPDGKFRCVAFGDAVGAEMALVRSASLTVEKKGDHLLLDFSGTSPENPSSYNAHVQAAVGHLANYLYSYIFHDLPISSATFAPIDEGDVISYGFSTGGSGYGDPLDADPKQVVEDVEAKIISDWSARNIYKVSYDPILMRVNREETEALRQEVKQARLKRGKNWDEFMEEWSQLKPPDEALTWFGSWPDAEVVTPVFRP